MDKLFTNMHDLCKERPVSKSGLLKSVEDESNSDREHLTWMSMYSIKVNTTHTQKRSKYNTCTVSNNTVFKSALPT